jgi:sec-independent protein translocase protein TatC
MLTAVVIAMPVLVYQFMAFVAPGLTAREKRVIFSVLPAIIFMFLLGMAFAYFIALPSTLDFLYHFNSSVAQALPSLATYISLVVRILLVMGLIFETPLIIMALARLGVVSPRWLAARRKWWVLLAFIIAAVVTPTIDVVTQIVVAVVLILLLELGILLSRLVYKKKREPSPQTE